MIAKRLVIEKKIMNKLIILLALTSVIGVSLPIQESSAHSGRTDRYGCHHNRKTGGYHCH